MMQTARALVLAFLVAGTAVESSKTNPLAKVYTLMDECAAKIVKDGEAEAKAYKEYIAWCDDASANLKNDIKTATSQRKKLEASISNHGANIAASTSKIEDVVAQIAAGDAELTDATAIREKESGDYVKAETELVDAVDTLDRAITTITREAQKNPAAFTQVDTSSMSSVLQSLSVVIDAAGFATDDKQKLVALVQAQQGSDDEEGELGAPAAAVYKSHSGGITQILEDMKEKAEGQLSDLRKAEQAAKQNYNMLKQSLEAQMAADTKDKKDEEASRAANEEGKATAEGDLANTEDDLKTARSGLATAQSNCMTVAADHETCMKARDEELAVIAKAKEILKDTTSGAEGQSYSLLQVAAASRLQTRVDLKNSEIVVLVKRLAREHHSAALAQLASRIG